MVEGKIVVEGGKLDKQMAGTRRGPDVIGADSKKWLLELGADISSKQNATA